MDRFQTLLAISTCGAAPGEPRRRHDGDDRVVRDGGGGARPGGGGVARRRLAHRHGRAAQLQTHICTHGVRHHWP